MPGQGCQDPGVQSRRPARIQCGNLLRPFDTVQIRITLLLVWIVFVFASHSAEPDLGARPQGLIAIPAPFW